MMTHNDIIQWLLPQGIPARYAQYVREGLRDDFVQYCYCIIFEMKIDYLQDLYERGKLRNYFERVCYLQANNKRSTFYQTNGNLTDVVSASVKFERDEED